VPRPSTLFANRAGRPRIGASNSTLSASGRWSKNARPTTLAAAKGRSNIFVRSGAVEREWETIQELFLTSRPRFVGLAYSVLRNREDAEDAVQDALVSAFRHLRGFEGRSALTTWFTRIVLNAALMIRRKRKLSKIEPFPETCTADEIHWAETIPDSRPDPEMALAEKETFQWIDVLLTKMSPLLQQAFRLTYYDEMSNEEAGAFLGVATGTFKSRVFRARQDLLNQAQRILAAPIHRAAPSPFPSRNVDYQTLVARPMEMSFPEIVFS
jgi:RNA polymerase sigma-70 factor, ECF subfamily